MGTWTHTFSPNILNEARFGASWITVFQWGQLRPSIGNLGDNLGIANANTNGPGLLELGFGGGTATEINQGDTHQRRQQSWSTQKFADTVIQFDDGVTITHGKHVFKAGFQLWRFRMSNFYSGNSGEYGSFLFTVARSPGIPPPTFLPGMWAERARVSAQLPHGTRGTGGLAAMVKTTGAFLPTLTLNLGLRYEATHAVG